MEMRIVDVLNNIKGNDYDIGHYGLCRAEADVCIVALRKQIPYKLEYHGKAGDVIPTWKCECGNLISGRLAEYCYKCGRRVEYGE